MANMLLYLKQNRARFTPLLILGFLAVATLLTLTLSRQSQEIREQAAANTGQLTYAGLNPSTVLRGQTFTVSINLSSQEADPVVGADVLTSFDASKLTLTAITRPPAATSPFKTYAPVDGSGNFDTARVIACANNGGANCHPNSPGIVEFGIVSFDWGTNSLTSPSPMTVVSPVATLTFQVKNTAAFGSSVLNFVNNGITATTDSNIVVAPAGGDPEDILQALPYANSSATITIASGASPSPSASPSVSPSPSPSPSPSASPSPSPSATPQVTPTPGTSPSPGTGSVIFQVRLEGVSGNQGGDKTIKVTLMQGTQTIVQETPLTMSPNATGVYSNAAALPNVPAGTYDVYVNGPSHITRRFTGVVIGSGNNTENLTTPVLLAGDVIDNNRVDIFDYNDLVTYFGCRVAPASPPPGKTCSSFDSDFDFDGDIDIFDYNFMVGNFNDLGD